MKNNKLIAIAAGAAALTLAGGSFAAYAAETDASKAETARYSYSTGKENGAKYADSDEETDKTDYSYIGGRERGIQYADSVGADESADKTDFSFNTGKVNGTQYAPDGENEDYSDSSDYSYNAGRQSAADRMEQYADMPTEGTKDDVEAFYESHDVGGGAWVDGEYDESAKADYSYTVGQQRATQYAQDSDGDYTPDTSDYSYSMGRQSYMESHENWRK